MSEFLYLTDGYKLDHRRQYPPGTTDVYSNFTPRMSRIDGCDKVVFFGLQYFLSRYLTKCAEETFFQEDLDVVLHEYKNFLNNYLGPNDIGTDHIAALHDLGYIPLEFFAVPEGMHVPLRMPMFTFRNTHPDFFWVTNFIETILSCTLWQACTSATIAARYRSLLDRYCYATNGDAAFVPWQAHDFSFRGQTSLEAAALSGAGHLLSFTGTDSLPAIRLLQDYYGASVPPIGGSIPATEHSVMCAGDRACESLTFSRILDLYPKGPVSVVSDTWDFWAVVDQILPELKDKIITRDGKLVIRPDSGDPVKILLGDRNAQGSARVGLIRRLWDIFGGTTNAGGYKVLDPHIGAIYGDSITYDRALQIMVGLNVLGFASTNVVLGVGSYTYQYVTRDTFGFAVKATHAVVDGEERMLFKDPLTDDGVKKSARGMVALYYDENQHLRMHDGLSRADHAELKHRNILQPVWRNGRFSKIITLEQMRMMVRVPVNIAPVVAA